MDIRDSNIYAHRTQTPFEKKPSNGNISYQSLEYRGYELAFREWLRETSSFQQFIKRVTNELEHLGFSDWAYSRLDIPLPAGIDNLIGTPNTKQREFFSDIDYCGADLVFQHTARQKSCMLRSSINTMFEANPLDIDVKRKHRNMVKIYEKFKFHDHFSLPLYAAKEKNHANFSCATKGADSASFISLIQKNEYKIHAIAKVLESVGIEKFPESFLGKKIAFERIISSRGIKLLEVMAKKDFNISQAANELCISRASADKQLAKIRDCLNTTTTHGALIEAIRRGYIEGYTTEQKNDNDDGGISND